MNFRTGQKVVCVNDHFVRYCSYPIKKGVIYTIDGFYKCRCGSYQLTLRERSVFIDMICKCNRISYRRQSYYSWRFIPLDLFDNIIDLENNKFPDEIIVRKPEPGKEVINNNPRATPAMNIYLPSQFLN